MSGTLPRTITKLSMFFFQARESYLRRYDVRREFDDSYTSVLGLHFDVLPRHFRRNVMQLKCTSTLLSVYWQSSEVSKRLCEITSEEKFA